MGCKSSKEKKKDVPPPTQPVKKDVPPPVAVPREAVVEMNKGARSAAWLSRLQRVNAAKESPFRYGKCGVMGKVTSFFPPHGLCYLVEQDDTLYVYNDTMHYEMHVSLHFSQDANVTPLDRATKQDEEDGSTVVSVVVYPLETVEFVRGTVETYKSNVFAQEVSKEYQQKLQLLTRAAAEERQRVWEQAGLPLDDEVLLSNCMDTITPFVDLSFEPSEKMFCRPGVDGRFIAPTELRRATECHGVNRNEVNAIRGTVVPHCIDSGLLCDHWLTCAMTALAEDEERVKAVFADSTARERQLGAYRLLLNKNGWWKSVLVDDFLPVVNDVPCFARVLDDPSELWPALLEKAYAKLHGSYASITGGDASHALRDFTGAPSYRFDEAWLAATQQSSEANALLNKLMHYVEAGNIVLLNTPAATSVNAPSKNGLRAGYTYYLKAVHSFPSSGVTMLNMVNPWEPAEPWTGEWSANSEKWNTYAEVRRGCNPDFTLKDGSFWMEWTDAAKQFDGCSVVFVSQSPVYDYRVRGEFSYVQPSVVFMVRAAEPVTVVLTLTQQNKRGLPLESPDAKFSPLMLTVSRGEGNKQHVDKNSSSDPEAPSEAFTFVVSREVAMTYTFEPSDEPYFVVPRIHRKGTSEGRQKEFVLGVRSATPLEGKLDIQFTTLSESSPVLHNRVVFVHEETEEVVRPLQTKKPGEAVVTTAGSKLSTATMPEKPQPQAEAEKVETPADVMNGKENEPLPDGDYPAEENVQKANGTVDADGVKENGKAN